MLVCTLPFVSSKDMMEKVLLEEGQWQEVKVNEFPLSVNMATRLGRVATSADHFLPESLGGAVDSQAVFLEHFEDVQSKTYTGATPSLLQKPLLSSSRFIWKAEVLSNASVRISS